MRSLSVFVIFALILAKATVVSPVRAQNISDSSLKGNLILPKQLNWPDPDTSDCKFRGIFTTGFSLTITVDGLSKNIRMVKSSGNKCLDKQALKAVPLQTWRPAMRDGKPEEYVTTYDITFQNY